MGGSEPKREKGGEGGGLIVGVSDWRWSRREEGNVQGVPHASTIAVAIVTEEGDKRRGKGIEIQEVAWKKTKVSHGGGGGGVGATYGVGPEEGEGISKVFQK